MAFVERRFEAKDFDEFRRLLDVGGSHGAYQPNVWLIDSERGISFYELGGRGEMPASTGAPPNEYVLVVNGVVYRFDLRERMGKGRSGGISYYCNIESIYWPSDGVLSLDELLSLIREVLFASAIARKRRINLKYDVDEVFLDASRVGR